MFPIKISFLKLSYSVFILKLDSLFLMNIELWSFCVKLDRNRSSCGFLFISIQIYPGLWNITPKKLRGRVFAKLGEKKIQSGRKRTETAVVPVFLCNRVIHDKTALIYSIFSRNAMNSDMDQLFSQYFRLNIECLAKYWKSLIVSKIYLLN